ncbi:MAG: cytochrome P450 [Cyanophyceae cyanobacterium]
MKIPAGPKDPAALQTFSVIAQPIKFLETCAERYGNTFTLNLLGTSAPVVCFSHPQTINQILSADPENFEWGKLTYVFRPLTGPQSLILLDGQQHRKMRHLVMPPLHGQRLHTYSQLIVEITQAAIASWPVGSTVCMRKLMSEISIEVILRVVFGLQPGPRYSQLKQLLKAFLEYVCTPLHSLQFFLPQLQQNCGQWSPWGRFIGQQQQIDRLLYEEIASRREATGEDILSLLIAARDEQNQPLTTAQLRDQLITLLLLGHETTASALCWAMYWIHKHDLVQKRLWQELNSLSEPMAATKLPYLNAVCAETLRIYPIALISQPRLLKNPLQLEDYQFTPGTVLIPCIYLSHHRSEVYPEPHKFEPERFLEGNFSPYEYLPFGGGYRSCIGQALSLFEMKLVLATILSQYQLALCEQSVRPIRRGITIVPSGGPQLLVVRKHY